MIKRLDARTVSPTVDRIGGDYDAGLEHNHHWACERIGSRMHTPVVCDASSTPTPSSVVHDDAIYAVG